MVIRKIGINENLYSGEGIGIGIGVHCNVGIEHFCSSYLDSLIYQIWTAVLIFQHRVVL